FSLIRWSSSVSLFANIRKRIASSGIISFCCDETFSGVLDKYNNIVINKKTIPFLILNPPPNSFYIFIMGKKNFFKRDYKEIAIIRSFPFISCKHVIVLSGK